MIKKIWNTWAIDTQSTEGHDLLGRYFFDCRIPRTPSLEGCKTALFKSREIARQYCKNIATYEGDTWKPKVIKVKVIIESDRQER